MAARPRHQAGRAQQVKPPAAFHLRPQVLHAAPSHRERILPSQGLPTRLYPIRPARPQLPRLGMPRGCYRVVDLMSLDPRCLIPGFDGAVFSQAWRDALWAKFFTAAPPRQRRSVERYSIVKRARDSSPGATGSTRRRPANGGRAARSSICEPVRRSRDPRSCRSTKKPSWSPSVGTRCCRWMTVCTRCSRPSRT
jgi:hypothetical protein